MASGLTDAEGISERLLAALKSKMSFPLSADAVQRHCLHSV